MPTDNCFRKSTVANGRRLPTGGTVARSNLCQNRMLRVRFTSRNGTGTVVASDRGPRIPAMLTTREAVGREGPSCWC
jgi:hypothetical protein